MNKELQSAKDEAARELKIGNHMDFMCMVDNGTLDSEISDRFIDRALELYGDAQWNAAIEKAAEEVKILATLPDGVEVKDGEEAHIPEGQLTNLKITINKQSILKLKKP